MIELAAKVHRAAPSGFDPFSLLPFLVPVLLVLPLLGFAIIVSTFRTRRPALNTARTFTLASWLVALFAAFAVARHSNAFSVAYQWINVSLAFTGPAAFQGFGVDVSLQLDHAGALCVVVLELITLLGLAWSGTGSRAEPGLVRLYAVISFALFAALGVALSGDLAGLVAFWGMLGAAAYLSVANRWGNDETARASRVALALPFASDLALLAGVALLYSRYGRTDTPALFGMLHTTPGWGYKSLTAAAILVFVGAAGRAGVIPFTAWLTRTAWANPSANALLHGTWPLLAALVVYRTLPVFRAAGPQAFTIMGIISLASAVLAGVWALVQTDAGRALTAAGSAHAALVFVVLARGDAALGLTVAVAGALARTGGMLALGNLALALRTRDLTEMGEAFRRLRVTSLALAVATVALAFSLVAPGAEGFGSLAVEAAFAVALVLLAVACVRVYVRAAYGRIPRRRAFDPERVAEVVPAMRLSALLLALAALVAGALGLVTPWLAFVDGRRHVVPSTAGGAGWLLLLAVVLAGGALLFGRNRRAWELVRIWGRRSNVWIAAALASAQRGLARPGLGLVEAAEQRALGAGEVGLGSSFEWVGRLTALEARDLALLACLALVALVALAAAVLAGTGA